MWDKGLVAQQPALIQEPTRDVHQPRIVMFAQGDRGSHLMLRDADIVIEYTADTFRVLHHRRRVVRGTPIPIYQLGNFLRDEQAVEHYYADGIG